jgi:hypothetical protein
MTTRGVYYIAVNESGIPALEKAVRSVQSSNPGLPVAVATDYPQDVANIGGLAQVIPVERHILGKPDYPGHGFFSKVAHMYKSPFDLTLFLDYDTYVLGDLSDIFTILEQGHFDMAMAHEVGQMGGVVDGIPEAFRQPNTGVLAFRRCETVARVMQDWWAIMQAWDNDWADQFALRHVLWSHAELRYAILPCEWNLRFIFPALPYNRVRILHGRPLSDQVGPAEIGAKINQITDLGHFWFKDRSLGHYDLNTGELAIP